MSFDLQDYIESQIRKLDEQKEMFLVYALYKNDLNPEDYVLCTENNFFGTRMWLERKETNEND